MTNRPLILITNDDGIASPGLLALIEAVADLGDLLIVAPSAQQTGAGRSYPTNIDNTVHNTEIAINGQVYSGYKANVSPAQAVSLAVLNIATRPIDLCISGINYGENIGSGVTISGTVGAAIEAACYGIPALAVSFETPHEFHHKHGQIDFGVAGHFAHLFAKKILINGLPQRVDLFKVDIPASATPNTPWRAGRVSRQRYHEMPPGKFDKTTKQAQGFSYHVRIEHDSLDTESDVHIFSVDKQVAVVPMTIDLTAPVSLPEITHFFNNMDPENH